MRAAAARARRLARGPALALTGGALTLALPSLAAGQAAIDPATFGELQVRAIGPAVMSGRIAAIDAVPAEPLVIYVGAAGGGVWKSTDGGVTFKSVFDDHPQSIGAITVDPSKPETVWVGTGESWVRNSVSVGAGVYRSADGGESWESMGLADSERIARIAVHPRHGDTVFVCATGHLWDGNGERGVFRTTDGGQSWKRVLFVNADTGCSDLALDPQDPRILYAGMWQFRRRADFFTSGGPGSALYKSTDGGETWRKLERGLPAGEKGRIAVAVAPSRPSVVYAVVEAKRTALYRSDDLGESWTEVNASPNVQARPFYFALVVVDPTDFNRVYKPGFSLGISADGGRSFSSFFVSGSRIHSDHHALWINPRNPHELLLGTDGGLYISHDRGGHWRHVKALPVSQFYEVSYDAAWPYNVYGGLQDNGSWMGPSRSAGGIQNRDWQNIGFGDGFHAYPDPADPDIAYVEYQGGNLLRVRKSTRETKEIKPYPGEGEPELRFNWNTPVHLSSARPGTIYVGAQFLFRSADRGDSWERISPDLTTNDAAKQRQRESGGLTIDNSTAENHTTICTISESPRNPDVIWVGTDDGNLQVTRDGGRAWRNVAANAPGLPPGTWVSHVEAGHHDEGVAYATFDGHWTGDMRTYVYRTADFGQTWEPLGTEALEGYAHVIREDPVTPDLLFLGTELGLFISVDRGRSWARFEGKLPKQVAVRDLAIHPREHDLIVATHGRGLYILDDVTPLRHLTREALDREVAMLPSRPAVLTLPAAVQEFPGDEEFVGANPPEAATIVYHLKRRHMFGDLRVELYDSAGQLVATHPGGKRRGINRVEWPMRLRPPRVPRATSLVTQPFALFGPRVPEGSYTVRLVKGDETHEGRVTLVADPRASSTAEERAFQNRTAMALYRRIERLAYVVEAVAGLRDQAQVRAEAIAPRDGLGRRLAAHADRLEELRRSLVSTSEAGFLSGEERLREKLVALYGAVNGYTGRPTESQLRRVDVLGRELDEAERRFAALTGAELDRINAELARRGRDRLSVLSRQEWEKR